MSPTALALMTLSLATFCGGLAAAAQDGPSPASGTAPAQPPAHGLAAFYYPNQDFSGPAQTVIDPQIAFEWLAGPPRPGMPSDHFSVRWLGQLQAPISGDLTLIVRSDDGIRVWLDGRIVINDWIARAPAESRATFAAEAGRSYDIRIDYFEATGGADIALSWEGASLPRQIVPTTALMPLVEAAQARIPLASAVSPVCISGLRRPDLPVVASVDGRPQRVLDLPETGFYFNARLDRSKPAHVQVGAASGDITWTPTVLTGDQDFTIRKDDALLLTSPVPVHYSIVMGSGVIQSSRPLAANARQVATFRETGAHQIVALDRDGLVVGTITVTVVDIDFDGPIAGQVGYQRDKGVEIIGGTPEDVRFATSDESLLDVSVKEPTDYGVRVYLTPRRRGTPTIIARIASSGAIIDTQQIDEFTLSSESLIGTVRNGDDGSAGVSMIIRPWIPDLTAQFRIFAHLTTFEGGGKALDINTNDFTTFIDPITRERCARTGFQLSMPAGESLYCFKLTLDQHSRHGTPVGGSTFNGSACDFDVALLSIEEGDVAQHPLVITEGAKNPDNQHHGKHKQDHPIALLPPANNQLELAADPVNGATFNCITEDNWRPLVKAKAKAKTGFYSVVIHGTTFKDKIEIYSLCQFDLSATEEKAGKPKLYRLFPKTSVTITATLTKKGSRDPATHTLVVSGPTAIPPFEVTCPKAVGQSVSVKIDAYASKLAAGSYDARILNSTKTGIFTVADRQTLNNIIDSYGGKELGFVTTGGSSIKEATRAVARVPTWTTTITGTFPVTYENNNQVTNNLKPGGSEEWSAAERAKAPDDEVTNWGKCVDFVQKHEEGHLKVWHDQQRARTETVVGTGTAPAKADADKAAIADYTAKSKALVEAVPAEIKATDDRAQDAFHQTPTGSSDLSPFKIPDRD